MFDAAHVLGLIAGGEFQDPLHEGADVMTASTHKTLPGPQGGVVLAQFDEGREEDVKFRDRIDKGVFPGVVSSHHLHHMAAKAVAFAEAIEFGRDYARQIVRNARALGAALHAEGLHVACEKQGFTASHQVLVDVREHGGGKWAAETLEKASVITNMNMLPGDTKPMNPSGIRLGAQELTRLGMRERDMGTVAQLISKVLRGKMAPEKVAVEVADFRRDFRSVHYCYGSEDAYKFWQFVRNVP